MSGQPHVCIYNPSLEQHNWCYGHTVIEIVNDDIPLLFSSVTMEINRQGLALHSAFYPIYHVQRDDTGMRVTVEVGGGIQYPAAFADDMPDTPAAANREAHGVAHLESTIHIEIDRPSGAGRLRALHDGLIRALSNIRAAMGGWNPMQAATQTAIDALTIYAAQPSTGGVERAEITEA